MRKRSALALLVVVFGLVAPIVAVGGAPASATTPEAEASGAELLVRPSKIGPYAVGRTTVSMTDPSRSGFEPDTFRTLTVDVWYPSDPEQVVGATKSFLDLLVTQAELPLAYADTEVSLDGDFPLVVFSHGSGGIRFQSWFLMEFLASHGFVVVAPDHAGNTALDGLFGTTTPFAVTARNRPLDVSFVLDQMLASDDTVGDRFENTLDERHIGVVGHSFGGFTALAMEAGYGDIAPDPRVDAIVPVAPAAGPFTDAELSTITDPMLLLGGTSDITTPILNNTTRPWELVSSDRAYRVDIDRAGHNSFTNICDLRDILLDAGLPPDLLEAILANAEEGCAPELLPIKQVQRITNLYVVSFLQRVLNRDGGYQRFLTRGYARSRDLPVDFYRR
ncbi:MAG: alpha/beta fold hydrolase [Acidimicrobiales bacterium]